MKYYIVLFLLVFAVYLSAQEVEKLTKEKVVTVDVKKEGDENRVVKIVTESDGESKVIEWTDQGEIPAEIVQKLEEEGIDVKMLDGGDQGAMIEIEVNGESGEEMEKVIKIKKEMIEKGGDMVWIDDQGEKIELHEEHYKIITKDDEGNEKILEWDGEGEMPEEIKKHLEENEIELHEELEGRHRRMRIHQKDGRDMDIRRHRMRSGEDVFFFDTEHDRPGLRKGATVFMGAQVGNHDEGAEVLELIKDSPADKAKLMKGDVVTAINGAKTRSVDGFMGLLTHFDPGDKVELTVIRDGAEKQLDLTFTERPEYYK